MSCPECGGVHVHVPVQSPLAAPMWWVDPIRGYHPCSRSRGQMFALVRSPRRRTRNFGGHR